MRIDHHSLRCEANRDKSWRDWLRIETFAVGAFCIGMPVVMIFYMVT